MKASPFTFSTAQNNTHLMSQQNAINNQQNKQWQQQPFQSALDQTPGAASHSPLLGRASLDPNNMKPLNQHFDAISRMSHVSDMTSHFQNNNQQQPDNFIKRGRFMDFEALHNDDMAEQDQIFGGKNLQQHQRNEHMEKDDYSMASI